MKNYHVVLSVTDSGNQLNHVPLAQYWLIRYEIGTRRVSRITLTMPSKDRDGELHPVSPIEMNVDSFRSGYGFSCADIARWLQYKRWGRGTLLLFKVSFTNNHLDYRLVGKVDKNI